MSISVSSICLPGKSKRAIAHDAAIPKVTLSGTAIAAVISVRRIAARASGSVIAAKYAPIPFCSASVKTAITGMKINSATNTSAIVINAILTAGGSAVPGFFGALCD